MRNQRSFSLGSLFRSGLLFLIPTIVLYVLGEQLWELLVALASPFDLVLPEGYVAATLVVLAALAMVVLIAGLIYHIPVVQRGLDWLQDTVLSLIPGYHLIRQFTQSKFADSTDLHWPAAFLIDATGSTLCAIVDEHPDGFSSVYIPFAPQGFSGLMRVVPSSQLQRIPDTDAGDLIDLCLSFGAGTAELKARVEGARSSR